MVWGVELKNSRTKVSWEDICLLRNEGRLGIKAVETWNRAAACSGQTYMVPHIKW